MRKQNKRFCQIFSAMTVAATCSYSSIAAACIMMVPPVSYQDLHNAPAEMVAFTAIIEKISSQGSLDALPHNGFTLKLKVQKVIKGRDLGTSLEVKYGPCHGVPGKIGEKINVLAANEKGWHAPGFWHRVKALPKK